MPSACPRSRAEKGESEMSAEENKELIRRVTDEVYSQGKTEAIDRYYAPNWVLHDAPPNAAPDRDALKQMLSVIRGGFPDVRARIDLIVAEGDLVAYHTISQGPPTKEYFGGAPTRERVDLP